jgi:hypothetical protein
MLSRPHTNCFERFTISSLRPCRKFLTVSVSAPLTRHSRRIMVDE